MTDGTELTTVAAVHDAGSYRFTVTDVHGVKDEVILVPCTDDDGARSVRAYHNRCTHEDFRLDHGNGVVYRDGEIACPKHGATFEPCSGYCDNGDAKDTTLPEVEVACVDGVVSLVDDAYTFLHEDGIDDGPDGDASSPSSTSHLGF